MGVQQIPRRQLKKLNGLLKGLHVTLASLTNLDEALAPVALPKQGLSTTRVDPTLLYARIPTTHDGFVVSFDESAKSPKFGGYGSCSWIVWRLPDWKIVLSARAYLDVTTFNLAEYTCMNNGVLAAPEFGEWGGSTPI
ncbi:unnamed protein product [Phytophthora fragariaefolia]|uniref:Unnamed protein product n=1 Tax=Phytophthora fragariaefolia TaxID=1490495 RepID=A0A9W7D0C6_9STRA|nr:unnamed protein product [Phytophthora fragariaefolia]